MADTITLPIGGMSCQHCVQSITKALSDLPGVESVTVTLEPGQAVVTGSNLDKSAMVAVVEDLGFDAL
ncbi:MAG: heavy-metal-associated domain-containing protein [Planctomycetes bacterium]|nr:heavy-metal-associated domain-containing protein [Planctomycetota bacterium]